MNSTWNFRRVSSLGAIVLDSGLAAALSGCGGGGGSGSTASVGTPTANTAVQTTTDTFTMTLPASATASFEPSFHGAPVLLAPPPDTDVSDPSASAHQAPHREPVPAIFAPLSTRHLTPQILRDVRASGVVRSELRADAQGTTPPISPSVVIVYTPAQIRAAYGMPALPGSPVSSTQAAQMGAGQTIYLVDAYDDPNIAAELAAFNSRFGLPTCTTVSITPSTSLPLSPAPTSGCTFSQVYADANGARTATQPSYDSGWASEIALDVQWAHATAPYARIVLIEAPDSTDLVASISLANAMGPGVVSMSWGGTESGSTSSFDSYFVSGMTYLAATGDSGSEVSWPAVSPHVFGVSGTSLTYSGVMRTETVWSGAGGGVSQYTALPTYQSAAVAGLGITHRSVSDVAFNADPQTGQYTAVIASGSTTVSWAAFGGTSIATPQWAGVIAVANSLRQQASLASLGDGHNAIYQAMASGSAYRNNFLDVTQGSDGTCSTCNAGPGYDVPSGIGTPNVNALVTALSTAGTSNTTPVVTGETLSAPVGNFSLQVSVSAANPVTFSLTNAPAGMTISSTGVLTWSAATAGNYMFTVTATDTVTAASGQAQFNVTIVNAAPPTFTGGQYSGAAGTALVVQLSAISPDTLRYALVAAAPAGLSLSTSGALSWPDPMAGSFDIAVSVTDTVTQLSTQATVTLIISPATPPVVSSLSVTRPAGKAFTLQEHSSDSNAQNWSLSGAPAGMSIDDNGLISWATPVAGTYALTVQAIDTLTGLAGQATLGITIGAPGPSVQNLSLIGTSQQGLSALIPVLDLSSASLTIVIKGIPVPMTAAASGANIALTWANPVAGSWQLQVTATDSTGLSNSIVIPVTIN